MLKLKLVHEKDTKYSSVYSEYFPGFVTKTTYFNTGALRQEFGHVPEKLVLTVKEDDEP